MSIWLNGQRIRPWDPFLTEEDATQHLGSEPLGREGEVRVIPYVLPHHSRLTEEQHRLAGGRRDGMLSRASTCTEIGGSSFPVTGWDWGSRRRSTTSSPAFGWTCPLVRRRMGYRCQEESGPDSAALPRRSAADCQDDTRACCRGVQASRQDHSTQFQERSDLRVAAPLEGWEDILCREPGPPPDPQCPECSIGDRRGTGADPAIGGGVCAGSADLGGHGGG